MANLWHELDGYDRVLREAGRILRPGGRLAILDWRHDVSPPPGPPSTHRVAVQDAIRCLEANVWCLRGSADWPFSYLILASKDSLQATSGRRTE